ncbi:MAG: EF-hand domain-containing protein [Planctomycetota bacterium]|jgi:hypothetical protein
MNHRTGIAVALALLTLLTSAGTVLAHEGPRERQELRQEKREDRREAHQDRRENRQDDRHDRQEHRQDARQDRQEHRKDMRHDRREHRRDLWSDRMTHFDTDGNGELSPDERRNARDAHKAHRAKLARHIDADNDGIVSDMEWQKFAKDFGETDEHRKHRFLEVKQHFDANHDGELDKNERGMAMRELHARRIDMLEHFDTNEDGTLDSAEREKLTTFLKHRAAQHRAASGMTSAEQHDEHPSR